MFPSGLHDFANPQREFSLLPFWFWNDALDEKELFRQIDDFESHGVHGFVIHPRVGLPRDIGWLSPRMLHFMRVAIDHAKRRDMRVVLYDEGMYPSGSSSGQVVAENPAFASRCLAKIDLQPGQREPILGDDQHLVAIIDRPDGGKSAVIDRKAAAYIRGLHYIGEGPEEDEPPAGNVLDPDAVACFIRLVYDTFAKHFSDEFGKTIIGVFTDEPSMIGKTREEGIWPGNRATMAHVERFLGRDFTPHLASLWDDLPDAAHHRKDYLWAMERRLHETYFAPLSRWCEAHGLALCGHPGSPCAIGAERFFHIPGQDLVWRWVEPHGKTSLEGDESTQAKCSSSAMIHLGRRRNSNECYGAYGHKLTYEETKWLADWCFVRGVNLLYPHAFYYSIRGPRRDERPPDVGPNSAWWSRYKDFADYCARMCWLNTDSRHVCAVAILGQEDYLPWRAAKVLFQNQIDFNYLEARHLWEDATMDDSGIRLRDMHYRVLIIDQPVRIPKSAEPALRALDGAGRVICCAETDFAPQQMLEQIDRLVPRDLALDSPNQDARCRHVVKGGRDFYLLTNEGRAPVTTRLRVSAAGEMFIIDPMNPHRDPLPADEPITLEPYGSLILLASPPRKR